MNKFLLSTILLGILTSVTLEAEEWWLLDANAKECKLPPTIGKYKVTPRVILETFKGCKIEAAEGNDEIVFVECKGELDTTLVFTTTFRACNKAKQALEKGK